MIEVIKKCRAHPETEEKLLMLLYSIFTGKDYPGCLPPPKEIEPHKNSGKDVILPDIKMYDG